MLHARCAVDTVVYFGQDLIEFIGYCVKITVGDFVALHFQLLEQVSRKPNDADCSDALQLYNNHKNRYPDRVPCKLLYLVGLCIVPVPCTKDMWSHAS